MMKLGILVHGDNHFIVRGPLPDRATALALVRQWTYIRIGDSVSAELSQWTISTKEFRENLEWAVVAPHDEEHSPAVKILLDELKQRGIPVHDASNEY